MNKKTKFGTSTTFLTDLLGECETGDLQMPDFQRDWVWDEERIRGLIASISQAFPVGALMTLEIKGSEGVRLAHRPIEGVPEDAGTTKPSKLLLDGQQRLTSLYLACSSKNVVQTVSQRNKRVNRWFYFDIQMAINPKESLESAIVPVPENRRVKPSADRKEGLDLSSRELEYKSMMFPLNRIFDWKNTEDDWQEGFNEFWKADEVRKGNFKTFRDTVLENFEHYQVPVIELFANNSDEAVCLVFEKVNTGGKPLDAFELVTAMYAAKGHSLRDDWLKDIDGPGLKTRLRLSPLGVEQKDGVLAKLAPIDFLQAITLVHGVERRGTGEGGSDMGAVRATRKSMLELPLDAYLKHKESVASGFEKAAQFLHQNHVFRATDLPYQTQLVPLAAIIAMLGPKFEYEEIRSRLAIWYWCGVFGELYSSATETRFARDVVQVPAWLEDDNAEVPNTVEVGLLRPGRLRTLRSRAAAVYKGILALLMHEEAKDLRTGKSFAHTVFFDENVDIHHVFPRKWCKGKEIPENEFDVIANKTPLCSKTNRYIQGDSPSDYLRKLEAGEEDFPGIGGQVLDGYVASHKIEPSFLRNDDFKGFMEDRENRLLEMISRATSHAVKRMIDEDDDDEGDDVLPDGEDYST